MQAMLLSVSSNQWFVLYYFITTILMVNKDVY